MNWVLKLEFDRKPPGFLKKSAGCHEKNKNDPLNGKVDVHETLISDYSFAIGNRTATKNAFLIAVEILPDGRTGNLQMQPIENFTADTINMQSKIVFQATLLHKRIPFYIQKIGKTNE